MNRRLIQALFVTVSAWIIWSLLTAVLFQPLISSDYVAHMQGSSDVAKSVLSSEFVESHHVHNGNVTIGFIHMGKTGGSNLARLLMNGCHSMKPKPCKTFVPNETIISKLVQDYYHIVQDTEKIKDSNHSIYILTSRDPFARLVSSFVYMHPRNKATFKRHMSLEDMMRKGSAYKCFKSLESFAEYIGDEPDKFTYHNPNLINKRNCTILARAIVAGRVSALEHMYNNYVNMLQWIPAGKDIYIIRQEHIWDDWVRVNHMLGEKVPVVLPVERVRRNVTADAKPPVTKDLSGAGTRRLCRALIHEYDALFKLMHRAKNIATEEIDEAVETGSRHCPNIGIRALAFRSIT